jgi:hypothetical protein
VTKSLGIIGTGGREGTADLLAVWIGIRQSRRSLLPHRPQPRVNVRHAIIVHLILGGTLIDKLAISSVYTLQRNLMESSIALPSAICCSDFHFGCCCYKKPPCSMTTTIRVTLDIPGNKGQKAPIAQTATPPP